MPFPRRKFLIVVPALTALGALPAARAAQESSPTPAPPVVKAAGPAPVDAAPAQDVSATGPVSVRGLISDPDDAVIPGATITLTGAGGKAYAVSSGADGTYAVRGVPAGTYSLTVTMPGFAAFVRQGVRVASVPPLTVNAKLVVADQATTVNVTTAQTAVSVDQDANASSTVLKDKDLDALSDDPDELSNELSALAGPAAGPNGGQIYIDGFTGGQLPPKSSIREIRINQNPFSAQYDRPGFGRVEVFTKPGTDKLRGSIQVNGNDRAFNTGSPFITPGTFQPDYHTVLTFGSLTGPINKHASYAVNGSIRKIQDNAVVNPPSIYATSATSGTVCNPGTAGCAVYNTYNAAQFLPQTRWDLSPRLDLALGSKNTLTARFQYEHNSAQNQGIGNLDLQSTGYNSGSAETTLQLSDTQIISAKMINETRFEFQRSTSNQNPFSTAPTINVQGAFVGGGTSSGFAQDTDTHLEFQNYTSIALAKNFIRFGGRLRTNGETNTTNAGKNGTFTYNSIADYVAGNISQYSVTNIAVPTIALRSTDLGVYAETDWKARPNLTVSYGLRFETQNFIPNKYNFAPRLSFAYGLGKKTVLRAGGGIFYDRFTLGNQFNVIRNNGTNQQQYILNATSSTIPASCSQANPSGCPVGAGRLTVRSIDPNLHAPYNLQLNVGVDQQLFKGATMSVNYQHIRGIHQFNSAVANYTSLTPTSNLQYQYQSAGIFNQNQLVTNLNYRYGRVSIFGFYLLNFAKSDTSGANYFASVPNRLNADYGRATFDVRHRLFMGGNISLPHLVSLSPFIVAFAGTPYNLTTGVDNNGDTIFNDRVVRVSPGTAPVAGGYVKTIGNCGTFASPGTAGVTTPVPINTCTGPSSFSFNMRASKTWGIGAKKVADNGGQGGPGGPGGPGGGGPPQRHRGGPGGPDGGGASSGQRYSLTLGAQAFNLFNVVDRSVPVGTLTSNSFGQSTQLAGFIFSTDSAVRRVSLQLSFSF